MGDVLVPDDSSIDPHLEVKKLQDLVKKLERQNEVLRGKQTQNHSKNLIQNTDSNTGQDVTQKAVNINNNLHNNSDNVLDISLENIDEVDVEKEQPYEDEFEWLFSSPKAPSAEQRRQSPLKWVRKDFEHPSPEVQTAKRSLIFKLDEVSRRPMSRSSSGNTLGSLTTSPTITPTKSDTSLYTTHHSQSYMLDEPETNDASPVVPSIKPALMQGLGSRVDTSTFTRPKKNKDGTYKVARQIRMPQEEPVAQNNEDASSEGNEIEEHRLADVVDVQVLARMQEENLRRESSNTLTSPRRCDGSNGLQRRLSHGSNGPESVSSESPSDSPYGSQHQLQEDYSELRGSLPNLQNNKKPSSIRQNYSESKLSQMSSRGNMESPRQMQAPGRRMVSPRVDGGARQASPGRQIQSPRRSIQAPRAGIPRPGTKSGLPAPRRSGIPSPRTPRANLHMQQADESWKDGCY